MKKNFNKHIDESFIPLSSNEFNLERFIDVLKESNNNHFFNDTSKVEEFEEALKRKLKTDKEVICVSSGTAAIHLALVLAGVQEGDYVICQSFTYIASINPILYVGAAPVFIDSNAETWNMDLDLLEEALKDLKQKGICPKAIIAVNIYGMPSDMNRLLEISKKYDVKLIEDSAESFGSEFNGISTGTQGDFGILSFNNNKILSTGGGGALICKNKEQKEKTIFYANQARERDLAYTHQELGYNFRFSNIQAVLGLSQLNSLDDNVAKRKEINQFYQDLFQDSKGIKVFKETSNVYQSNHWLTCILIDEKLAGFSRIDLQRKFNEEKIETRFLWKPMHLQPIFKKLDYYGNKVAENLFTQGLCLPSGSNLTEEDRNRISTALSFFLT
tara:strand:+ start:28377 stop:29537 length:1161 start_codon:yes stop_codon:yes gene_type:complete